MKMAFLLVLAALVVGAPLVAQGYVYAPSNTPTSGGCNSWPFRLYPDWRFQFIIPAKFLPAADFKVVDLAVAPCSSKVGWAAQRFQVRMTNTTVPNFNVAPTPKCFDTMLGPCPTVMRDGPIKWNAVANTWSDLGLRCSFAYRGSRTPQPNILVEIRYQSGPGSAGVTIHTDPSIPRAYIHNAYTTDPFNAPCWHVPIPGQFMGPKVRLTIDRTCVLTGPDTVSIGTCCKYLLSQAPSGFYQFANSLSTWPGINLGTCRLCLNPDPLFFASLIGGPPTFVSYTGTVGSGGQASAAICIPKIPALVGIRFYAAAIVYDPTGIRCCSNSHCKLITP